MFQLVTAFDFKVLPNQFFKMTKGEIELLLSIRERHIREVEAEMSVRRK